MPLTQVQSGLLESGAALNNIGAGNITPSFLSTQAQYTGFKNRIFNGQMQIDQRNAGASINPTDGQYTVDRFLAGVSQTSRITVQQSSIAPTGFSNSLLVTSSSAYSVGSTDYFDIQQRIEGFNTSDLAWGTANAQTVTLSFWVRSSLTGTFGGCIRNSGQNYSYVFSYSISAANTWEQKTITIPGPTAGTWIGATNGVGMIVQFALGMGSVLSNTAGSWYSNNFRSATGATSLVGTNGATWYVTGVQLEKGSTATSFDYRPYGTEFMLCQRYFELVSARFGGAAQNGSAASGTGWFKVEKRATPTITWISTTALLNFPTGAPAGYSPVINTQYFTPFKIANGTNYDSRFDDYFSASAEL